MNAIVTAGVDPSWVDNFKNMILDEEVKRRSSLGIQAQDKSRVQLFIALGNSTSAKNSLGQTPLHLISAMQPPLLNSECRPHLHVLAFLANHNERKEVNEPDNFGCVPLHYAASVSEYNVDQLVRNGTDLASVTREGLTALHIAAISRQSNIVSYLITHLKETMFTDMIDWKYCLGRSALHYACRSGRIESKW